MTIGIICALSIEVEDLKKLMTEKTETVRTRMVYTKGLIDNTWVVAVECGIGKVNAAMCAQIMIDVFAPDIIINSGIAGALSPDVHIGDVVVALDVVQHDMDTTSLGDPLGEIFFNDEKLIDIPADKQTAEKLLKACKTLDGCNVMTGRIATGDTFVADTEHRLRIHRHFDALACEMEGGAIAQVCYRNRVPFGILRSISDSMHGDMAEYQSFRLKAAETAVYVMTKFIRDH